MKSILKMILRLALAVFAIMIVTSVSSSAQTGRHWRRGNINARQENQQDRIAQGINNGTLTPAEAARLESQEARINALEARLREDGLTSSDRARLERDLNRERRNIFRAKHDGPHR